LAAEFLELQRVGQDVIGIDRIDDSLHDCLRHHLFPAASALRQPKLQGSKELELPFRGEIPRDQECKFYVPLINDDMLNECNTAFWLWLWFWLHGWQFLNDLYACLVAFFVLLVVDLGLKLLLPFLALHEVLLDVVDLGLKLHLLEDVVNVGQLLCQLQLEVVPGVLALTSGGIVDWKVDGIGVWLEPEGEDATGP
jgi:hypothetical protein